jgi:hypothetical protein
VIIQGLIFDNEKTILGMNKREKTSAFERNIDDKEKMQLD